MSNAVVPGKLPNVERTSGIVPPGPLEVVIQLCSETVKPLGHSTKHRYRDGILPKFHRYILDFQQPPLHQPSATIPDTWPAQVIENNHFSPQDIRENHMGANMLHTVLWVKS
jgi:hypothetical protein